MSVTFKYDVPQLKFHTWAVPLCDILTSVRHMVFSLITELVLDVAYCFRCTMVCVSVGPTMGCTKTTEPIVMVLGMWTWVGPRNRKIDGAQIPGGKGHLGHLLAHFRT